MNFTISRANGLMCFLALTSLFSVVNTRGEEQRVYRTRMKGEIACYSCFAKNPPKSVTYSRAVSLPPAQTLENMTDLLEVLNKGGMTMPKLIETCGDTTVSTIPTFIGSAIHVCPNTDGQPGACVKFRGNYEGESFVYRECWSEMWKYPRPYRPQMSGHCFADNMVQNFVESSENIICFCEDDLCNGQSSVHLRVSSCGLSLLLLSAFFCVLML